MLKSAGYNFLAVLVAGTLTAGPTARAGDEKENGYVLDSYGNPVVARDGCVLAPNQPKDDKIVCSGAVVEVPGDDDADGDGVPNNQDKCPNTPQGVKVDASGCPIDSDGDGVPDYLDACPNNTAEEISKGVDAKGCPVDSDGDGVPDYRDDCPNTAPEAIHKVGPRGCAEIVFRFDIKSEIYFDFDKAILKPKGKKALDEYANKVIEHLDRVDQIIITGYADYIGTEAYNMKLSERRAQAAANYLTLQGKLPRNLIKIKAMGEKEAVQGATAEQRAKDRHVVVDTHMQKK